MKNLKHFLNESKKINVLNENAGLGELLAGFETIMKSKKEQKENAEAFKNMSDEQRIAFKEIADEALPYERETTEEALDDINSGLASPEDLGFKNKKDAIKTIENQLKIIDFAIKFIKKNI